MRDVLDISKVTLERLARVESSHFCKNSELLKDELVFLDELRWLYYNITRHISDDLFVPLKLMCDAGHSLVYSAMTLMRGHIVEAVGSSRRAIEAAAFAFKTKDPKVARVWIKHKTKEKEFMQDLTRSKFPKSTPLLCELQHRWELASELGSHSTLSSQIFRHRQKDGRFEAGYFDLPDDPEIEFKRSFNYWILDTQILILEVFQEIFKGYLNDEWKERLARLKERYGTYKQSTLRKILKRESPKASRLRVSPGGVILPAVGDIGRLLLR